MKNKNYLILIIAVLLTIFAFLCLSAVAILEKDIIKAILVTIGIFVITWFFYLQRKQIIIKPQKSFNYDEFNKILKEHILPVILKQFNRPNRMYLYFMVPGEICYRVSKLLGRKLTDKEIVIWTKAYRINLKRGGILNE